MTNIQRVRAVWTGFPGAPGVSTFYCLDAAAALSSLRELFAGLTGMLPNDVTINVEASGDAVDPITGTLSGAWAGTAPAAVVGTTSSGYAAPVGALIKWTTGSILDGHRLVGKTFIVPIAGASFENDGTLGSATWTSLDGIAGAVVTALADNLVVWHRPRAASVKHPTARTGGYVVVTGHEVPDKAVVLRSRRA